MLVKVKKDFRFAEDGIYVTSYSKGQTANLSKNCLDYALANDLVESQNPVDNRKRQAFTAKKLLKK